MRVGAADGLLYYVTPGWRLENGGNLELWDCAVRRNVTLVSQFNRLVLMETTPWSWHSVSPVVADGFRCCVSNYYAVSFVPSWFADVYPNDLVELVSCFLYI